MSQQERKNLDNLLKLIEKNPDLPVVPMVKTGVVAGDNFGSWMGKLGESRIDEYLIPRFEDTPIIFKSADPNQLDVLDALENVLPINEVIAMLRRSDCDCVCQDAYKKLPWKKAIIVSIDTNFPKD